MALWQKNTAKTRHFGKITAFDENHGFRDYLLSLRTYHKCHILQTSLCIHLDQSINQSINQ